MNAPVSDFCQRWRERRHSWRHRSEGGFDAARYDVAPLAESSARSFVEVNHYAASYPAARLRFGLYDGPWLVGVAVLGVPMQRRVLTAVFPSLEPSLNLFVRSTYWYRSANRSQSVNRRRVGMNPLAGTCRVMVGEVRMHDGGGRS
jgi:hypothetical protein